MTKNGTLDWGIKEMSQFKGLKAFILDGAFYGDIVQMFAEAGFERANTVSDADVVVFAGGADINPALYGQEKLDVTWFNQARDDREVEAYRLAREQDKPMFGICRGAQFLHAMNGGELWQDVSGHGGGSHYIVDLDEDVRVLSTSIHHQMLKVNDRINVLAVCEEQISYRFQDDRDTRVVDASDVEDNEIEIEAGTYTDTKCFFVQGHPEIGCKEYRSWTFSKFHDFLDSVGGWSTDKEKCHTAQSLLV